MEREARNTAGRTPLEEAIYANNLSVLPLLLDRRYGVATNQLNKNAAAPLHQAAFKGDTSVASMLLDAGAQFELFNSSGQSPLHIASAEGHSAFIKLLLSRGANPDAPNRVGVSPLVLALKAGKPAAVDALLTGGASRDARDWRGWTPLHMVSEEGHASLVHLLLDAGATASCLTAEHCSPLHLSARSGRDETIEALVDRGLDPNARDHHGATPLHLAALLGHTKAAMQLLELGADPFLSDAFGWQPLHKAAHAGNAELVQELLARGAIPSMVSEAPLTPVQAAAQTGQLDILDLLTAGGWDKHERKPQTDDALSLAVQNAQYGAALHLLTGETLANNGFDLDVARERLIRKMHSHAEVHEAASMPQFTLAHRFLELGVDLPQDCLPEADFIVASTRDSGNFSVRKQVHGFNRFLWLKASSTVAQEIREMIHPVDRDLAVTADAQIEVSAIPWYSNVRLVRIHEQDWPQKDIYLYYLKRDDGALFRLNGTSPPIHEVNATSPIELNVEHVLDYLVFFGYFVRGEEGGFYIVESMDDPLLARDLDPETRKVLQGTVRPAVFESVDTNGFFLCNAVVFYSNAVFIASYAVRPGGMMEMRNDEPIAADLPLRLHAPISL